MKKKNLFTMFVAAVALTFSVTGCSNDDDVKIPEEGVKATLSINLDTPTMSRATGDAPEDAVGDFTVFVTDKGTGDINTGWTTYSTNGSALTGNTAISVTTNAQHVYIVANAGDRKSITTLAGLKAFKADLNIEEEGKEDAAENRWATGATIAPLNFEQDEDSGDYEASTTVTLKFIAARIVVTVDNRMEHYEDEGAVTLENVSVLNARGESLLFPAGSGESLVPGTYTSGKAFYTGYAKPAGEEWSFWPTTGTVTLAEELLTDALDVADKTKTYYYYVFENDATTTGDSPTIVTLTGKSADGASNLYWPVHLASYEQWGEDSDEFTTLTRGNSYNLNITLTGDAASGGGGTTDPTDPLVNGEVKVILSLTPWNTIELDKEF